MFTIRDVNIKHFLSIKKNNKDPTQSVISHTYGESQIKETFLLEVIFIQLVFQHPECTTGWNVITLYLKFYPVCFFLICCQQGKCFPSNSREVLSLSTFVGSEWSGPTSVRERWKDQGEDFDHCLKVTQDRWFEVTVFVASGLCPGYNQCLGCFIYPRIV